MSIHDEIKKHLGNELFLLTPLIPSQRVSRTMFVSKEINSVAHPPWPAKRSGARRAQMRAAMDAFVEGRRISVANDPYRKRRTAFMARNAPVKEQVFDIRCLDPSPGIRIFGRFVALDTFVALIWDYRENLNGRAFDYAVTRCIEAYGKLFPTEPLFGGATLNDYLTNFFAV